MGCTSSIFCNSSSSIQRCRSRRRLMIDTIQSLKNLVSIHHAYFSSMRRVAASLIVFASGEPLYVSDVVPPLYIQYPADSVNSSSPKVIHAGKKESQIKSTELEADKKAKPVEVRMAVRHRNFAEIAAAVGECFMKASDAGEDLFELLQIRLDKKKKSNGLLRLFRSKSRSKKLREIQYQLEATGIKGSLAQKNHCTTLEKLLAFEKKLYEEVKIRERLKMKHEKKLKVLENQEYNAIESSSRLEKTEASMNRLRSRFCMASEAVSNTSNAIIRTRDNELAPQLLGICNGMLKMWRKMNHLHYTQFLIIQQVGDLINPSTNYEPTTNLHHAATRELGSAIADWHMTFKQMIKRQHEYVYSVHNWLELTILNFTEDSSVRLSQSLNEWNQTLDGLPDSSVSDAIQRFWNVLNVVFVKQTEEMMIKGRVDKYRRKVERKSKSLRKREKKYDKMYRQNLDRHARVDFRDYRDYHLDYERELDDEKREREVISERKKDISEWLRKVDEETKQHEMAVIETRKVALNGIKMSLPRVFQTMARFSGLFVEGLESVYRNAEPSLT